MNDNDLGRSEAENEVAGRQAEHDAQDHSDIVCHDCQHAHVREPHPQDEDHALSAPPAPQLLLGVPDFRCYLLIESVLHDGERLRKEAKDEGDQEDAEVAAVRRHVVGVEEEVHLGTLVEVHSHHHHHAGVTLFWRGDEAVVRVVNHWC